MDGGPGRIAVPEELTASHVRYFADAGRAWIDALPELAATYLDRWDLRLDGPAASGAVALVLPVVRADRTGAALKLQPVDEETRGEAVALRAWTGRGAVAVLEDDPGSGTMLLQRLDPDRTLSVVPDDVAACAVIAGLLRRLHTVEAPAGMRRLTDIAARMLSRVPRTLSLLADPHERDLVAACTERVEDLLAGPVEDRLLHWDLHYDNVLARRPGSDGDAGEPWVAIDPKPLSGDPGFDLLPALWNRWDDVVTTGDVRRAVLRRFDVMREVMALEPVRAEGWTLARVLQEVTWDVGSYGGHSIRDSHRCIAEALLSRTG